MTANDFDQSRLTKKLILDIFRLGNTVRVEDDTIAGSQRDGVVSIFDRGHEAERKRCGLIERRDLPLAATAESRWIVSRAGVGQRTGPCVVDTIKRRHEMAGLGGVPGCQMMIEVVQ